MSRLAILLLFSVCGMFGGACSSCQKQTSQTSLSLAARCTGPEFCPNGMVCDTDTQTCVEVCTRSGTKCDIDQIAVPHGFLCSCLNRYGIGMPCSLDTECPAGAPIPGVLRLVCRSIVDPDREWPTGKVCVPDRQCDSGAPCPDPENLNDPIQAKCERLNMEPDSPLTAACSTQCANPDPVDPGAKVFTRCRFDQVPVVTDGTCTCQAREDPWGRACKSTNDCSWPTGLLGNVGPPRVCRQIVSGSWRCVPSEFCIASETKSTCINGADDDCDGIPDSADPDCCAKSETPDTCANGADDDCDGIPDGDDPDCFIEQCKDRDGDGYCDMSTCGKRKAEPGDRPRSVCLKAEMASCDSNAGVNPGVPERCNRTTDDNCDGRIDEDCDTTLPVDSCEGPRPPDIGCKVACKPCKSAQCEDGKWVYEEVDWQCDPVRKPRSTTIIDGVRR